MHYLGIDIGTTTICGVVTNNEGTAVSVVTLKNDSAISPAEQNANAIFKTVRALYNLALAKYNDIVALGISNQMHGIVYYDETGVAVSHLFTWQDKRGDLPCDKEETYAKKLSRLLGQKVFSGYGLVTHYYLSENGLLPQNAAGFCSIGDYIAMRFCSIRHPVVHNSNAAAFGGYCIRENRFCDKARNMFGEYLPSVCTKPCIVGKTRDDIPVLCAIGDNQSSVYACLDDFNDVVLNVGTGSQISAVVQEYTKTDASDLEVRPFIEKDYLIAGSALCGGKALALYMRFLQSVFDLYNITPPEDMYSPFFTALKNTSEKSVYADTRFNGTRNNPNVTGSIEKITGENFLALPLGKGIIEGIGNELFAYYLQFPESVKSRRNKIVFSGNGIRLNEYLQEYCKQLFGKKTVEATIKEECAYGVCKIAAKYSNMD